MPLPEDQLKKLTVKVLPEDFDRLADNLHHGQLTHIVRGVVRALGQKIEREGKAEIYLFLDGQGNLELKPPEGDLL